MLELSSLHDLSINDKFSALADNLVAAMDENSIAHIDLITWTRLTQTAPDPATDIFYIWAEVINRRPLTIHTDIVHNPNGSQFLSSRLDGAPSSNDLLDRADPSVTNKHRFAVREVFSGLKLRRWLEFKDYLITHYDLKDEASCLAIFSSAVLFVDFIKYISTFKALLCRFKYPDAIIYDKSTHLGIIDDSRCFIEYGCGYDWYHLFPVFSDNSVFRELPTFYDSVFMCNYHTSDYYRHPSTINDDVFSKELATKPYVFSFDTGVLHELEPGLRIFNSNPIENTFYIMMLFLPQFVDYFLHSAWDNISCVAAFKNLPPSVSDHTADNHSHENAIVEKELEYSNQSRSASSELASTEIEEYSHTTSEESSHNFFILRKDFWEIKYLGKTIHVKNSIGMQYLNKLVKDQEEVRKCTELVQYITGPPPPDETISKFSDVQLHEMGLHHTDINTSDIPGSLREIERGIKDTTELLEMDDLPLEEKEAAEELLCHLKKQRSSLVDERGKSRSNSMNEVNRKSVSKALHSALKNLQGVNEIYEHFKLSLSIGSTCCYKPSSRVDWQFTE